MAHLNNVSFDCVGIRFLNLIKAPILWLAFLQLRFMKSEKLRSESSVTPKSWRLSVVLISSPFTWMLPLLWLKPMFMAWYFLIFPAKRFEPYQFVAKLALSLSCDVTAPGHPRYDKLGYHLRTSTVSHWGHRVDHFEQRSIAAGQGRSPADGRGLPVTPTDVMTDLNSIFPVSEAAI